MKLAVPLLLAAAVLLNLDGNVVGDPANLAVIPRCGLIGSWRGTVTIPDGADGVPAMLLLRFSQKGREVSVRAAANNKPLVVQSATANCFEFSFVLPQTDASVEFSGKLANDGLSVSGTARRNDVMTSWRLERLVPASVQ